MSKMSATEIIAQSLTLPCGLTLPNRLVKCPMQETLPQGPYFGPPIDMFENLYTKWATSSYGLLITGQIQVSFYRARGAFFGVLTAHICLRR